MSKSYTLADGSTVTVTATENGVPFNEGMQALTKAIKARVSVRDGSGTGGASSGLLEQVITFDGLRVSWLGNGAGKICRMLPSQTAQIEDIANGGKIGQSIEYTFIILVDSDGTYAQGWRIGTPEDFYSNL